MINYYSISLIQAVYICYMYSFFKTTMYIHHPLEIIIQRELPINFWLKHPISDDEYSSKICPFGKLMGFVLAAWIIFGLYNNNLLYYKLNIIVWVIAFFVSLVTNFNAFIYLIPCLFIEFVKVCYLNRV